MWIGTDAIAARLETLLADPTANMEVYRGILTTIPNFGKGTDSYSELETAYRDAGGNTSDFGISSVKTSLGLELLFSSLSHLDEGKWDNSPSLDCTAPETWEGGTELFNAMVISLQNGTTIIEYDILNFKTEGLVKVGGWGPDARLTDHNHTKVEWFHRDDIEFIGGGKSPPDDLGNSLTGYHIRIGIVPEPPIAFLKEDCSENVTSPSCWTGWNPDIMKRLAEDLNFTYEFVQPEDGKYGSFHKDTNSWTGIIKDIIEHRVDFSGALAINSERSHAIGYTTPILEDQAAMVVYLKSKSTTNMFFFLEPFELSVWAWLAAIAAGMSILMAFLGKLSSLGRYGKKIHAMQTCPCSGCEERREEKRRKKCRFADTLTPECLVEEVEGDEMSDLTLNNSFWLIGTGMDGNFSYFHSFRFLVSTGNYQFLIILKPIQVL